MLLSLLVSPAARADEAGAPASAAAEIPWQVGIRTQYGRDALRDSDPMGIERVGLSVQLRFVVVRDINERLAIGAHAGLGFETHGVETKSTWEASYTYFDPGIDMRISLGRFAVLGWGSYVIGDRSVEPRDAGLFSPGVSSAFHGPRVGATALVSVRAGGGALEMGPFIELGRFSIADDDDTREVDESTFEATSWKLGLALQLWAGAPPL